MVYTITEIVLLYFVIYDAAAAVLTESGSAIWGQNAPVENQQILQIPLQSMCVPTGWMIFLLVASVGIAHFAFLCFSPNSLNFYIYSSWPSFSSL